MQETKKKENLSHVIRVRYPAECASEENWNIYSYLLVFGVTAEPDREVRQK